MLKTLLFITAVFLSFKYICWSELHSNSLKFQLFYMLTNRKHDAAVVVFINIDLFTYCFLSLIFIGAAVSVSLSKDDGDFYLFTIVSPLERLKVKVNSEKHHVMFAPLLPPAGYFLSLFSLFVWRETVQVNNYHSSSLWKLWF